MNTKTLSERLQAAMEYSGLNQAQLARACGVSAPSVHGWLSGKSKFLRGENLLRAAHALGVNENWLATGAGPMVGARPTTPSSESPFVDFHGDVDDALQVRVGDPADMVAIPRVKLRLRAGIAQFDTDPDMSGDGQEWIPRAMLVALRLNPVNLIAMPVRGTSMEPMMFEDDVVIVDKSDTRPISREIYAVNFDGEPCIKQLLLRGAEWYLNSLNPDHGPVNVKSKPCSIVGRVVYQPGRSVTGRL